MKIDRIRMQLPAGFEHRGSSIARLIGDSLGRAGTLPARRIESLVLPPMQLPQNASDQVIADMVAARIVARIGGMP